MDNLLYPVFADWAKRFGVDAAMSQFQTLGLDMLAALRGQYEADVAKIESGGPMIVAAGKVGWYSGPNEGSIYWPPLRESFVEDHWPTDRLNSLDNASNVVVAHTPKPEQSTFGARGLVVGFVQSGKTTNFLSVIAKLADENYRLVVVLSGIHNSLRKQTQQRLRTQLQDLLPKKWHMLTTEELDFHIPPNSPLATLSDDRVALAIVKKNATVLRRLIKWLDSQPGREALLNRQVLVIDDEADQASVATKSINPLIRRLLEIAPKSTYIGYTATPFANVFIDPAAEDLYPKDFILNLPRPDGYFGPEVIFGRDVVQGEDPEKAPDGYDMIRIIPDSDIPKLRPLSAAAIPDFAPVVTEQLRDSVRWFWLASAARRARGQTNGHSTMLIHTSVSISVHESFRGPLLAMRSNALDALAAGDEEFLDGMALLWTLETSRVPAGDWGREQNSFEDLIPHLSDVINETQVILDNSRSQDRLLYPDDHPIVAIAVGGDTLSRGLTLEGLVVSFFVRAATAYDTLLQMGRWFGFREGYQDLPRIWMTSGLRDAFRHLASVEQEMRNDIDSYQRQDLTPLDVAVRIRTHPSLRITAKMGAAKPAFISYAGRRLQTRYFRSDDRDWLDSNLSAGDELIAEAIRAGHTDTTPGSFVVRDVPARLILGFLGKYQVHEDSPDLDPRLMANYIDGQIADESALLTWSVAVVSSGGENVELGGIDFRAVTRAKLRGDVASKSDIKTLMSKQDRVLDLNITTADAKAASEQRLMGMRNEDPEYHDRGLLVLYPIDHVSSPVLAGNERQPLNALRPVLGMGIVFPGDAESKTQVKATYLAVDLTDVEVEDLSTIEDDTEGTAE